MREKQVKYRLEMQANTNDYKFRKWTMMGKTFYLMRHGQTLFNVRIRIQVSCDSPLTELGVEQAKIAGNYIKELGIGHYYCSTAERASDTIELAVGEDMPYTRLKGLKERAFGVFEGESEDLHPQWENGFDDFYPKFGGETSAQVEERIKQTCTEIMDNEDHETVLAVSHAGASSAFLRSLVGEEEIQAIFADGGFTNCAIAKYTYANGEFEFVEIIRPDFSSIEDI